MPARPSVDRQIALRTAPRASEPGSRSGRLSAQAPERPLWRYRLSRLAATAFCRLYSGYRAEGLENLPSCPAVLVFNHQNWVDPLYLVAVLPVRPRSRFFGPEEEDMTRGFRNRLMRWAGIAIPYRPGRRGLMAAMQMAEDLLAEGWWIGIAGEGRIHSGEKVVLPLRDGPAYLAVRAGVPLVPVAVNGTSWLGFRRRVRIRVGPGISPPARAAATAQARASAMADLTFRARRTLVAMASDFVDPPGSWIPGRWLTELFNEWPEGGRPPVPPDAPVQAEPAGRVDAPGALDHGDRLDRGPHPTTPEPPGDRSGC